MSATPSESLGSEAFALESTTTVSTPIDLPDPIIPPDEEFTDKSWQRLQFLLKQSTVYASILSEKMQKQQEEQRKAKEKAAKVEAEAETKPQAKTIEVTERIRRSGRTGTKDDPVDLENAAPAKPKGKRGRPAKKGNAPKITDFLDKDELEDTTKGASTRELLAATAAASDPIDKLGAQALKSARQPSLLTGAVMKDYQLEGLEWLISLYENGLNGILADEMGLGKTIQTISLLAFLREKGIYGPFLVVAPVSTLSNWVDEIERFCPTIPALLYHGTIAERAELRNKYMRKLDKNYPIICTSYELIMNDRKFLQKTAWKFIIIDEGHRLKNLNCKLIRELKTYHSANRLLLTGTPLQNNLSELWSLLNFLLPDIFDDLDAFQSWFDFSALQEKEGHKAILEQDRKSHIISSLHAILKPFLLRRVKADVETSLPPKREYILYAPLTQAQKELYKALLDRKGKEYVTNKILEVRGITNKSRSSSPKKRKADHLEVPGSGPRNVRKVKRQRSYTEISDREYFKRIDEQSDEESEELDEEEIYNQHVMAANKLAGTKKMQNLIMQLRLACDHPYLFYWPWMSNEENGASEDIDERLVTESGKMLLIDRLVPELFARGHKVLIFSQFTSALDIIEDWASVLRGYNVCRIDGTTKQEDRRAQIKDFNTDPETRLFLLSTRAGGLGINLTSADTVILFDSDWNPQQDLQAQDRAHRIGQKRPVIVFRLATANTVEQTILEKADAKRRLEKLVIKKGAFKSLLKNDTTSGNVRDPNEELNELLIREDFEKVDVFSDGQDVLPQEELEVLLDRSPEAYERAEKGEQGGGKMFRVVENKTSGELE